MRVLILGVNGFIGSHLAERILDNTDWEISSLDIAQTNIQHLKGHSNFLFNQGTISAEHDWISQEIRECDVVLPLAAIAQPKLYGEQPLKVFELDFEENLKIIRLCVEHSKRVLFPSTSEVYGISGDDKFSEEETNFVYGPTSKVRWIYAGSKQLLERLIYVYGRDANLDYTIFRPFNWIGPRLDSLEAARKGYSRALTQFFAYLIDGKPIALNNGGQQRRSFTDITDAIDVLFKIIESPDICNRQIFNIGNPENCVSILELAELTRKIFAEVAGVEIDSLPQCQSIDPLEYYGRNSGFQDIEHRVPDIKKIRTLLGWEPRIPLATTIRHCAEFFLNSNNERRT